MKTLHLSAVDTSTLVDLVTDYRQAVADNGEANEAAQRVVEWLDARLVRSGHLGPEESS